MNPYACPCPALVPVVHSITFTPDFTLQWRLCQKCETDFPTSISVLASTSPDTKWFGLGVRPTSFPPSFAMNDADMVIGIVSENSLTDYYCKGIELKPDQKNNLFNTSITKLSHRTYSQWFRPLNTGDGNEDHIFLLTEDMNWIWTLETDSNNEKPQTMPKLRGKHTFSLVDNILSNNTGSITAGTGNLQNVKIAHGIIMGVGWGFFMPLSALAVRYSRASRSGWLNEHVALTKIGATGTISFVIVAIAAGPQNIAKTHMHAFIGVCFALIVLLVTVSGSLAKTGVKNQAKNRSKNTWRCCRIFHIIAGWGLVAIAFFQIPLGIEVFFKGIEASISLNWMKEYLLQKENTVHYNTVLRVVALIMVCIYFVTIIVFEVRRCKTGYYRAFGGFCASLGTTPDDHKLDAFVKRTKNRFLSERAETLRLEEEVTNSKSATKSPKTVEMTANQKNSTRNPTKPAERVSNKERLYILEQRLNLGHARRASSPGL
jgi:hypothetical protein